jgi:UTP--glucose-1-phosphate uridylyltransferase
VQLTKAVVPVAGLGKRLRPLSRAVPKALLPLGRKPVVHHVAEELLGAGIREICLVTGPGKAAIAEYFAPGGPPDAPWSAPGVRVITVPQDPPRGLGDAVGCARAFVGEAPFGVALGDTVVASGGEDPLWARLGRCLSETDAVCAIAVEEVAEGDVSRYGIVAPASLGDPWMRLSDLVEKPSPAEAPSRYAIAGRYSFTPPIFVAISRTPPGVGGEIQLTDAIRLLLREGAPVYAVPLRYEERRYDIGSFASYTTAFADLALADPELGPILRAHLSAGRGMPPGAPGEA